CADLTRLGRLRHDALQNRLRDRARVDLRQQPDELLLSLRRLDGRHEPPPAWDAHVDAERVIRRDLGRIGLGDSHAGEDARKLRNRLLLTLTREQRLALNLTLQSL